MHKTVTILSRYKFFLPQTILQIFKVLFTASYFIAPLIVILLKIVNVIHALLDMNLGKSMAQLAILIGYTAIYLGMIFLFFMIKNKLRILEIKNQTYHEITKKRNRSRSIKLAKKTSTYLYLIVGSILFLFPMVWMIASSTKTDVDIYKQMGTIQSFFPNVIGYKDFIHNYKTIFVDYHLWKYALNSIGYAFVIVIGNIIVNSLAGYILAKYDFPGKKAIFTGIILLLIIPVETTIIPLYTIVHNLGLTGTVFAVIIPPLISLYNIFLFRQFFLSIPREIEEAAIIDGASKIRVYFNIILPLSKPIIATVATFSFIGTWNDYIWPIMVLPAPSGEGWPLYPIQAALNTIQQNPTITTAQVMASLTLTTIPMIIFYAAMQKHIVEGLGTAGVKF